MLGIGFVFSSSLCCICLVPPCTPVPSPALPWVGSQISPSSVTRIPTLRENCSTVHGLCLLALQLLLPDGNTLSTSTCVYDMLVLQVLLNVFTDRHSTAAARVLPARRGGTAVLPGSPAPGQSPQGAHCKLPKHCRQLTALCVCFGSHFSHFLLKMNAEKPQEGFLVSRTSGSAST